MGRAEHRVRSAGILFALAIGLSFGLGGCAALGPGPASSGASGTPTPEPAPVPPPANAGPAVTAASSGPGSVRPPAPPPATAVAILYSGAAPTQAAIAGLIAEGLAGPAYAVHSIDVGARDVVAQDAGGQGAAAPSETAETAPGEIAAGVTDTRIVAAVGPDALALARRRFERADIVVSQVLDPAPAASGSGLHAIAPTPPPSLQLAAWAGIDPGLERIGLITSEAFAARLPDLAAAAAAIGAELVHEYSSSDRETLFLFRRLAPAIDGFWLAPDSAILSTAVIDEILMLAADLELGVLVFSEALLERGGLLAVGAPPAHVAATVVDAIEQVRAGYGATLPAETPLREGAVRVNAQVAAALGLPPLERTEWVIRD